MIGNHQLYTVSGTKRAPGWKGMSGNILRYEAKAWVCPADGRLYHTSLLLDPRAGVQPEADRLSCCLQKDLPSE